jgi:hypothetical protein
VGSIVFPEARWSALQPSSPISRPGPPLSCGRSYDIQTVPPDMVMTRIAIYSSLLTIVVQYSGDCGVAMRLSQREAFVVAVFPSIWYRTTSLSSRQGSGSGHCRKDPDPPAAGEDTSVNAPTSRGRRRRGHHSTHSEETNPLKQAQSKLLGLGGGNASSAVLNSSLVGSQVCPTQPPRSHFAWWPQSNVGIQMKNPIRRRVMLREVDAWTLRVR